jgi:REP element-mobilizing transposase RayT
MVAGYHLIWTVYGYWLPNDPRGSTSKEVRVEPIEALGEHHYGRKPNQPSPNELREFFKNVHEVLAHAVRPLDDDDIALVGAALGRRVADAGYVCHACAVMPDHVHILIRRHRERAEDMIAKFRIETKAALIRAGKRPVNHPVWTDGAGWKTFVNSRRQFENEIEYIRQNPIKIGRAEQVWDFVTAYDGWLPE